MKKLKAKIFYKAAISVAKHHTASEKLSEEAKKLAKEKNISFDNCEPNGFSCHAINLVTENSEDSHRYRKFFMELCTNVNGSMRSFCDENPSEKHQKARFKALVKAGDLLSI